MLLLSTIFLFWKFNNASTRLRQIESIVQTQPSTERDSLLRLLDFKEAKEEYYLTQMDVQSNWFILYVTILFGVFALVGYSVFKYELQSIEDKNQAKQMENQEHFSKFEKRFKELEIDLRTGLGETYKISAIMNQGSRIDFAIFMIQSCYHYLKGIQLSGSDYFQTIVMSPIKVVLENVESLKKDEIFTKDTHPFTQIELTGLNEVLEFILKGASEEKDRKIIRKLISDINEVTGYQ